MENTNKVRSTKKPKVVWIRQPANDTRRIMTHKEKTAYIINGSLEYLGLEEECLSRSRFLPKSVTMEKRYMIPILYDYTKASMLEIAGLLGYKDHSNVSYHYRVLKQELGDTYGCDKTKMVYRELLAYLGIDSDGHINKHINDDEEETKDPKE